MLLKRLRLHNFRQYKGTQVVEFSTEPDKNVTVILGDNTYGKTTLLQAFNWCLYGKVMLDNPDDLLNYDVAYSMANGDSEDVEVEIDLIHNGIDYTITRSRTYRKVGRDIKAQPSSVEMCYLQGNQTETVKPAKVDSVIKSILPEGLSSYFFFDTERVASVSTRRDLGDSVKGLLGLTVLENAMRHLGSKAHKRSVLGKLHASMDEDGDKRARDALAHIQDAQERREEIKRRLEECNSEIEQLTARKEQLDVILRQNAQTQELQGRKSRLEGEVDRDTKALERTIKALRHDFSVQAMHFFVVPLINQAEQLLKDAELDDKGVRDLTRPTLEEILQRGTCVCGLSFADHPEAVEHIKQEMRYCPPESIGNAVRNYRAALSQFRGDLESISEGMSDRRSNIYSTTDRIQNNNDEIDDLSRQIQDLPNLSKYEGERNDIKRQLKTLATRRDGLIRDDATLKSDIERYQKVYDAYSASEGKNRRIFLYIRYAEEIASWLKETYDEKEAEIRESLEERVNSIFEQMYHGRRRVVIDSKYEVKLLTELGDSSRFTGESEGLNRVKNFAFIAGLVSLAKEKIVSTSGDMEFDLSSEPYPLVMDAPFSNTDETHIANISRVLPQASEQVIMFVMIKDWRYAEPVLSDRLGARYELDKLSEQHSVLKEV